MADDTDVLAITDHLLEAIFNTLLAQIIGPLLAGFAERLFLACVPDDGSKEVFLLKKKEQTSSKGAEVCLFVMVTKVDFIPFVSERSVNGLHNRIKLSYKDRRADHGFD